MVRTRNGDVTRRFETDARAIVPIQDEIGGTAIYFNGRLAYYVLNGEWIQAVPSPRNAEPLSELPDASTSAQLRPCDGVPPDPFVSTS